MTYDIYRMPNGEWRHDRPHVPHGHQFHNESQCHMPHATYRTCQMPDATCHMARPVGCWLLAVGNARTAGSSWLVVLLLLIAVVVGLGVVGCPLSVVACWGLGPAARGVRCACAVCVCGVWGVGCPHPRRRRGVPACGVRRGATVRSLTQWCVCVVLRGV
jgi:hypothetical protein